ncbi:sugar-transfer associated ATP-grasp domain-containing protein [Methylopila sp. M107]|uniref:sugar-transfer associated ATP-grasp domain-containing protein n=1 Tax=Methylopila sp. M107 TaxID=1101190 RepID=UPI0003765650|nr:sugar-transfer associated ATP-grasp domain-containing protein [Methylopila sp. M107]
MPATSRSIAASFFASQRAPLLLGGAVTLTALALQIASHQKPWAPHAPIDLSNQLLAAMGLAWSALQLWTWRRDRDLRTGWAAACLGMALLALEDNIDRFAPIHAYPLTGILTTIALSLTGALLIYACARRYAMRRSVMAVMRGALAVQLGAHGLALAAVLTAPLRAHGHLALIDLIGDTGELMSIMGYGFALLLTAFAPLKTYDFPLARLGAKAREIFHDFRIESCARYPTSYPLLQAPILRQFVLLGMAAVYLPRGAASARKDGAGCAPRQLARMVRIALGRGIDPFSFYLLGLYRKDGLEAADASLTRIETKNGLTRAIQHMRAGPGPSTDLNDKLVFWRICEDGDVASAPILALFEARACDVFADREAFDRDLFVKERKGRGGKFTLNFTRTGPFAYRDEAGEALSLNGLFTRLAELSADKKLILQPKLANHRSIASLARDALLVFRVVTCLDERDEPRVTHGVLRVLRRFEPSWPEFPEKEWGAAIDLETGALGPLTGDKAPTCGAWHARHPATGEPVEGRRLEVWAEIAEAAVRAHRQFASKVVVGWDIAMTPEGPMLLEGNANMDYAFIQRCYREPVAASPLGPLLDRQLDRLVARNLAELPAARAPTVLAVTRTR